MKRIVFKDLPNSTLKEDQLSDWLASSIVHMGYSFGTIMFLFVDKETMYSINNQYLNHKTDTDIITFDYSEDSTIHAEVYISHTLMVENAHSHNESVAHELLRLLSHAMLHCMGYSDKSEEEKAVMRNKENEWIKLFHVKH